jgi:hypothetical protein
VTFPQVLNLNPFSSVEDVEEAVEEVVEGDAVGSEGSGGNEGEVPELEHNSSL